MLECAFFFDIGEEKRQPAERPEKPQACRTGEQQCAQERDLCGYKEKRIFYEFRCHHVAGIAPRGKARAPLGAVPPRSTVGICVLVC